MPGGPPRGRIGQRPIAAAGGLAFAASFAYPARSVGPQPDYVDRLPARFVLAGAGVGMVLGTLPAVVTASLPPARFATGTGVFGMSRQLGAAVGVAVLVALLGDPTGGDLFAGLQRGWAFALGAGLGTAGLALALGPIALPQRRTAPELSSQRAPA